MSSAISKVDSKGRISVPIGLRAKVKLVEGSRVKILKRRKSLLIVPCSDEDLLEYGQSSVKASTGVCETPRPRSILGSDPARYWQQELKLNIRLEHA